MYYEEQWINEKLCWRATPKGQWIPFTIGQYKDRVLKLEQELKNIRLARFGGSLLERAVFSLDNYLNAGCKETRKQASTKAKLLYEEYYGVDYVNRNDR